MPSRGKGRGKGRGGGGGGGGGGRGKGNRGGSGNNWNQDRNDATRVGWASDETGMVNHKFEAYYHDQNILSTPKEWAAFLATIRQPLPTTFRITGGLPSTSQISSQMLNVHLPSLSSVIFEGQPVPAPIQMAWYPNHLAWSLDVKKNVLRKNSEFKKFQRFLVSETEVGNISRQEAVSMLPPLFMKIEEWHVVLDMCASPGSKTAQIVEMLHGASGLGIESEGEDGTKVEGYNPNPKGLVIANDSDTKRAHMLVHQSSRLPSPNLLVTNLDASVFPKMQVPYLEKPKENSETSGKGIETRPLLFDRILADVPCSGDGTIRKNIGIWKDWGTQNANGIHSLQLRILLRGIALLRPGGRLVYSTCSMNPIENEAVISAALRELGAQAPMDSDSSEVGGEEFKEGGVKLVDCSDMLPDLKRRKGLTSWKVSPWKAKSPAPGSTAAENGEEAFSETVAAAEASTSTTEPVDSNVDVPGTASYRSKVLPSCHWVSSHDELKTLDENLAGTTAKTLWGHGNERNLGIEKCMRVYPHDQNTGGFFVAVLEKKELPQKKNKSKKEFEFEEKERGVAMGMSRAVQERERLFRMSGQAPEETKATISQIPAAAASSSAEAPATADASSSAGTMEVEEKSSSKRAASPSLDEAAPSSKKVKSSEDSAYSPSMDTDSGHGLSGGLPYKEDPFGYTPSNDPQVDLCFDHFSLSESFPRHNLLVRNWKKAPLRSIYLTSDSVHALISGGGIGPSYNEKKVMLARAKGEGKTKDGDDNEAEGEAGVEDQADSPRHPYMNPIRLRLLSAGTKLFARQSSIPAALEASLECRWRATSDGIMALRPFVLPSKIVKATLEDLKFLIKTHYSMTEDLPDGKFKDQVSDLKNGSFVVDVEASECTVEENEKDKGKKGRNNHDDEFKGKRLIKLETRLTVPVWRAPTSINLMLDKQEKTALSHRLFGIDLAPSKPGMPRGKNAPPPTLKKGVTEDEMEEAMNAGPSGTSDLLKSEEANADTTKQDQENKEA